MSTKGQKFWSEEETAEDLLDRAYVSDDLEEIAALADRVLDLEPDNAEALLLCADVTEDPEERLSILSAAVHDVGVALGEMGVPEEDFETNDLGLVCLGLMKRLALTLFTLGETDKAALTVEALMRHDLEAFDDDGMVKALHYRILIERGEWAQILDEALSDEDHELGWAYARLFAAYMLARDERGLATAARMFWDALIMSPNVPFYMLGYREEPEDDASDEELEDFHVATLYADALEHSRNLLNWFSRGTLLFGLLSGRFEGEEHDYAMELLGALRGREDYDRMLPLIQSSDDAAIIETLAAHHCLAD